MRLYLFRHGERARDGKLAGHFDSPLSEQGVNQTARIAAAVDTLDLAAIYSSDLSRAVEAARRISRGVGLPFHADERLRELHLGWADGLSDEEAYAREPGLRTVTLESLVHRPFTTGGETVVQLAERVRTFAEEIAHKHRGRKVVCVGHETANRVLVGDALGLSIESIFAFRQDSGCLNIIEYGETKTRVALVNGNPAHAIEHRHKTSAVGTGG